MNAAEHIVEAYFRIVRGCFTLSDRKIVHGNNRQLDLLAYNLGTKASFHVEVAVTHRERWCPTTAELEPRFERKFFGAPPERKGRAEGRTDFERGKSYWPQIEQAYKAVGLEPASIQRVWVCWIVKGREGLGNVAIDFRSAHLGKVFKILVLSMRDHVLPELQREIGTSNYDDEFLRTLGFFEQQRVQTERA